MTWWFWAFTNSPNRSQKAGDRDAVHPDLSFLDRIDGPSEKGKPDIPITVSLGPGFEDPYSLFLILGAGKKDDLGSS